MKDKIDLIALEQRSKQETIVYTTYLIKDPRDNVPIYVGQTNNYEKRKRHHLGKALGELPNIQTMNVIVYLVRLKSLGFDPFFDILDHKHEEYESLISETIWIKKIVEDGYPLLNRWKEHRRIIKQNFTSKYLKVYFEKRLKEADLKILQRKNVENSNSLLKDF